MIHLIEKVAHTDTPVEIKDRLRLPFDERKRGRLKARTETGLDVGVFIDRGQVLRDGCLLKSDDHDYYQVIAADEHVTTAKSDDPTLFAKACYHLGNRHVPLQVGDGWLRYQQDYVLDDMLTSLGLSVNHEHAPFEPENGAYGEHGGHSHGHSHSHSHDHSHTHEHN